MSDEQIRNITLGEPTRLDGPVILKKYDTAWPEKFIQESDRIRMALGEHAILIEHIGSTSVPGMVAKPIIDILLVVADSANELSYVPALEAAGYLLRMREPEWHQHRLFKGPDTDVNLHVYTQGSDEIERNLIFRNWLRVNKVDRNLYSQTKKRLAKRKWKYVQNYADAKSEVIDAILCRANNSSAEG
jgi:GrpB-like predicted nucleotidyltransferase (UPF0157 family)